MIRGDLDEYGLASYEGESKRPTSGCTEPCESAAVSFRGSLARVGDPDGQPTDIAMKKLLSCALFAFSFLAIQAIAQKSSDSRMPATFESVVAAEKFTKGLIAGGRAEVLQVEQKDVLVVTVYGSGVPTISIGAYQRTKDGWTLAKEWRPETVEAHKVFVSGSTVMIQGEKTKKQWVLFRFDGKRG